MTMARPGSRLARSLRRERASTILRSWSTPPITAPYTRPGSNARNWTWLWPSQSTFGQSWSIVVADRGLLDADKPVLAVRGEDVYIGFNRDGHILISLITRPRDYVHFRQRKSEIQTSWCELWQVARP